VASFAFVDISVVLTQVFAAQVFVVVLVLAVV
jgi:hypothetical protein